jgi:hypothetical protein
VAVGAAEIGAGENEIDSGTGSAMYEVSTSIASSMGDDGSWIGYRLVRYLVV